jgi:hypothetical protein
LDVIAERPAIWPIWPGIEYIFEADVIVVLAIAHLRRRPGYWLTRLPARR